MFGLAPPLKKICAFYTNAAFLSPTKFLLFLNPGAATVQPEE